MGTSVPIFYSTSMLSYLYSLSFFLNSYKKGHAASLFVFLLCSFCFVLCALIKKGHGLFLNRSLQLKAKTRPLIHLRKHRNLTAVCLDDVFYDRKAKASSAAEFGAAFVDSVEAFENTR